VDADMSPHYDAAKAELLREHGISGVTRSVLNIVRTSAFFSDADWDGKDVKQSIIFHPIGIDKDFISFFKMNLIQGASFTGSLTDTMHFILNETAIKEMGIKDPLADGSGWGSHRNDHRVVVKDFHYASMKETIAPSVFWYGPRSYNRMYIKTTRGMPQRRSQRSENSLNSITANSLLAMNFWTIPLTASTGMNSGKDNCLLISPQSLSSFPAWVC